MTLRLQKKTAKFLDQLKDCKLPRHCAANIWNITSLGRRHEDVNTGIRCSPGHVGGPVRCVARPTCAVNRAFQDDFIVCCVIPRGDATVLCWWP